MLTIPTMLDTQPYCDGWSAVFHALAARSLMVSPARCKRLRASSFFMRSCERLCATNSMYAIVIVRRSGIGKRARCYSPRHAFATPLLVTCAAAVAGHVEPCDTLDRVRLPNTTIVAVALVDSGTF